ncbi:hypothetical protein AAT19DRAFT_12172 [Rhodotorula toruloides]|uniref:Uncharacterized protein n=1 Tax=Rhodotorula toruloides TaxID=5286 RepID=A0A2T0AFJ4_RHOTO|nr:hypothetical protein AAT19DRAFT_12172 [Rhodotorula toruloides]
MERGRSRTLSVLRQLSEPVSDVDARQPGPAMRRTRSTPANTRAPLDLRLLSARATARKPAYHSSKPRRLPLPPSRSSSPSVDPTHLDPPTPTEHGARCLERAQEGSRTGPRPLSRSRPSNSFAKLLISRKRPRRSRSSALRISRSCTTPRLCLQLALLPSDSARGELRSARGRLAHLAPSMQPLADIALLLRAFGLTLLSFTEHAATLRHAEGHAQFSRKVKLSRALSDTGSPLSSLRV